MFDMVLFRIVENLCRETRTREKIALTGSVPPKLTVVTYSAFKLDNVRKVMMFSKGSLSSLSILNTYHVLWQCDNNGLIRESKYKKNEYDYSISPRRDESCDQAFDRTTMSSSIVASA
jgi:hypothetical protein